MEIEVEYESIPRLGSSKVRFLVATFTAQMQREYPEGNVTNPSEDSRVIIARTLRMGLPLGFLAWNCDEEHAFVDLAWVRPDLRRYGIYTGMLKLMMAECEPLGISSAIANVAWTNEVSRAVHTKLFGQPRVIQFEQSFKNLLRSEESNGREVSAQMSTDGMRSTDRPETKAGQVLQPGVPAEGSPGDEEER